MLSSDMDGEETMGSMSTTYYVCEYRKSAFCAVQCWQLGLSVEILRI